MTLRVGLTGGLASGKSTAARRLRELGAFVVDADAVVRDLYRPGAAGARLVSDLFGTDRLAPDGSVDRPAVAALVFADADARRRLESRMHPLVRDEVNRRFESAAAEVSVCEATLLVEAGWADDLDVVVTVEAPPERRHEWAVARGLDPADASRRLAAQGTGQLRRSAADMVIENTGTLADLEARVDRLWADLRRRSATQGA